MRLNQTVLNGIAWGSFSLIAIYIAFNHEPWYDEYLVWYMDKRMDLRELFKAMTHEGHFMLWHSLVYPFVKAGASFWCLQLVSCFLIISAGWLLMMKSPFDFLSRLLILFSYPFLYEFCAISRCYSLIPIILFCIAWLYKQKNRHMVLYCLSIGILSWTHVYMEGLVAALFLLLLYEDIFIPYKTDQRWPKDAVFGACIIIIFVAAAFIQVSGSLRYSHQALSNQTDSWASLYEKVFLQTYRIPIKFITPILPAGGWFRLIEVLTSIANVTIWGLILFCLFKLANNKNNFKFVIVGFLSLAWQLLMGLKVWYWGHQRLFLPFLVLLFLLWLFDTKDKARHFSTIIIICFFVLTSKYGRIYTDTRYLYSPDTSLLSFVENHIEKKKPLVFDFMPDRPETYDLFFKDYPHMYYSVKDNSVELISNTLLEQFAEHMNSSQYILFVGNDLPIQSTTFSIKLLYECPESMTASFYKYVYLITRIKP